LILLFYYLYRNILINKNNYFIQHFLKKDDFNKFGCNFIGEIEVNFWGTNFEIYDYGYNDKIYEKVSPFISNLRKKLVNKL
jgi:hypothetical protein